MSCLGLAPLSLHKIMLSRAHEYGAHETKGEEDIRLAEYEDMWLE
jgi:hypothetical protein